LIGTRQIKKNHYEKFGKIKASIVFHALKGGYAVTYRIEASNGQNVPSG
jgi:hypothetical protein